VAISTTLDIQRVSPSIGAEVRGVDISQPLPDETIAAVRAAWLEHLVLFFPDQDLTPDQQVAFASRFGEVTEGHPVEHPLVRVHPETGRKKLFVNPNFTVAVKGMYGLQGQGLLRMLYEHMTQYEFICRYRWRPGTLAFWDNRATMHYGIYDYGAERRVMHRVTLRGDRPAGLVPVS
jgi:alpha-ketoglutarate-dependent taurine dioxygenase